MRRLVVLAVLCALTRHASAGQATCSNPGLPLGAGASRDLLPGRLNLSLSSSLLLISGSEVVIENTGRVRYDSQLALSETRLAAHYAFTSWLAIGGSLPFRVIDVGVDYFDPATGQAITRAPTTHVRDEQLRGLGDPQLFVHAARELGPVRVHARLGTTFPVGDTVENPYLLGMIGQEHQHIQLGTGTLIPFGVLEVQHTFGSGTRAVTGAAYAAMFASLYENAHGFRAGDRISGGASAASGLGLRNFTFGVTLDVIGETAETWDGIEYADEGNTGRIDTLVGGSIAWRPLPDLAIIADARYPVYSKVYGTQLAYGPVIGLAISAAFETRARPSYRGADVAVVGAAGSAAPLVAVANKLTVFDLWAEWCAPCRELDAQLAELARRYPDRLAVRKLDVVDTDSAAWLRYLLPGGFELPHIKVVDARGATVLERSAPPAELIRAIEQLLR